MCEALEIDPTAIDALNTEVLLENADVQLLRNTMDKHRTNNHGNRLVDFCIPNNIFICNGRVSEDKCRGKVTCVKGESVIDYFVCSAEVFELIIDFKVEEFDPLLSDVHCGLKMTLKACTDGCDQANAIPENEYDFVKYIWKKEKEKEFIEQFTLAEIDHIIQDMDVNNEGINVNSVCNEIVHMFKCKAEKCNLTMWIKNKRSCGVKSNQQTWYNGECAKKRKVYNRARNRYLRVKNELSREDKKRTCKEYRKEIQKAVREEKNNFRKKLKGLKKDDPKSYWKLLSNRSTSETCPIPLEVLKEHFEKLNEVKTSGNVKDSWGCYKCISWGRHSTWYSEWSNYSRRSTFVYY